MIERMQKAVEDIVRNVFPNISFYGKYRYRVVAKNSGDERWILQVVSGKSRLPDALPISIWHGVAGVKSDLAEGSEVLVTFIEGDPSLPIITHFCSADSSGWEPVTTTIAASSAIKLGKDALLGVARLGDMAGPFAITTCSTKVRAE